VSLPCFQQRYKHAERVKSCSMPRYM